MKCPKCETVLEATLTDGVEVDACSKCKGIWVQHIDEKKVLSIKPEVFSVDEVRRLRALYQPYEKRESVRYVKCPECHEMMQRRNWGSHSGVIVDTCREHGSWYDEGEVEKIQEFIAHGGIEYEKLRHAEKETRRVESRLTQEVLRLDKKVDSAYRRARLFSLLGF